MTLCCCVVMKSTLPSFAAVGAARAQYIHFTKAAFATAHSAGFVDSPHLQCFGFCQPWHGQQALEC